MKGKKFLQPSFIPCEQDMLHEFLSQDTKTFSF